MYVYNIYHFLKFKYFLCLNGNIFDLKKTSLKCYGFSVAVNVFFLRLWVKLFVSQLWIQTKITVDLL